MLKRAELVYRLGISGTEADVLIYLDDVMKASIKNDRKSDKGYYVHAGEKRIAEAIGKSVRTVRYAIAKLRKRGLIDRQDMRGNSRTYFIGRLEKGVERINRALEGHSEEQTETVVEVLPDEMCSASATLDQVENEAKQLEISEDCLSQEAKIASLSIKETVIKKSITSLSINDSDDLKRQSYEKSVRAEQAKAEKQAKKRKANEAKRRFEQLKAYFEKKLKARDEDFGEYAVIDDETGFKNLKSLAKMLAMASSRDSLIRISGEYVQPMDYFDIVREITREMATEILDRISAAKYVKNSQNYTLAAVYNACIEWEIGM